MIYEVAIDPEVLLEWAQNERDTFFYYKDYGSGTPRILSTFPKSKVHKLRSYLIKKINVLEKVEDQIRYEEMVKSLGIGRHVHQRNCENIDSSISWYENVASQSPPFDIVLTKQSIECKNSISLKDLYNSDVYKLKNEVSFSRNSEDFIKVIKNLLQLTSERVIVIDPYAYTDDAIKVIADMLIELSKRRNKSKHVEFTVVYKGKIERNADKAPYAKAYKQLLLKKLSEPLENITIKVLHIAENEGSDAFHNRYILNELTGIKLGYGLGFKEDKKHHTDEASILDDDIYNKLWRKYVTQLEFDIVSTD